MAYFEIELLFNKNELNKNIRYLYTMKTLTQHTICQLQTQRNEWAGISMFSAITNPATFNYGKVDYSKLEDTDVG